MGEKTVSFKRMVDIHEAIAFLEALAKSFREGRIVVEHGDKSLDMTPPSVVVLEIEAKQKKDKTKFGFEIAWKNDANPEGAEALKISSGTGDLPPAA
jgi:amphi-Trp domain-containing protein